MSALDPWMPPYPPLVARLWPAATLPRAVRLTILIAIGDLLLIAAAKAQVPFWPLPLTPQAGAVLLLAAAYGPVLGMTTLVVYLGQGLVGLAVFAATPERGLGLDYMLGPVGGSLIGYVAATVLVGQLARQGWDRSFRQTQACMAAGMALILVCSGAWLAWWIGPEDAWRMGVEPFLATSLLQAVVAGTVLPLTWRAVLRRNRLF